ncbi:MAG: HNH endonuclease [Chloroherpetonaceae bacterium]
MPGAKTKLLNLFKENVGKPLSKEKLATTADVFDWARSIRTLRQEGYDIELLENGFYVMKSLEMKVGNKRSVIDAKTRYRIMQRDNSTCQRCGRTVSDGIKLAVDHKEPVDMGGDGSDDNLWILCEECNLGKKHWFSDQNAEEMKKIFLEKSGAKRLEMFFDMHPNEVIEPAKLAVISGIRDWERTLRLIRERTHKDIKYVRKDSSGNEGYIYKK